MPIIFGSKVKLDTRFAFGLPVKEDFLITDKIPLEILQDIDATRCESTGTGAYAGMVNNYTMITTNEELWGTHVTFSSGTGTRIGRDNIIPAAANNPTRHSMNFLSIPFYDENGDVTKYFAVGLKNIYYSSANNYVEGSLFFGWSSNGDFDDTVHSATDTITAGLRWDYTSRNDYVFTNVQVIENPAFEGPGLHCPDSTEYKDLALLITIGWANSSHNPTGTQPYYIDWDIRGTDGAYLTNLPYSLNNVERTFVLPLGQINYLGSMVSGGGEQAQLFVNNSSEEVGPPSEPGGYEPHEFDETSDDVILSNIPSIGMSTGGFINVYAPTLGELSGIAEELLPRLNFSAPTPISTGLGVADAIINGFNNIATWLANVPSMFQNTQMSKMMDYVIDCHVIPVNVHVGNHDYIKVGWKTLTNSAAKVTGDYEIVDAGDLSIDEYFKGFADYLTTARLFLPFVGYVSMQPEWFNNALLNLTYYFNVIDGSFMALLRGIARTDGHLKSTTLLGQWGGSACVHFPLTGTNYANMMSGAIGGAAGVIAAAGTGSLAGVATSAIAAMGARGTVEQSNSYSASSSMLSHKRAFVQIERPVSSYSMNYQHEIGIPSNIATSIGSASGFVRSDDVHLDGIPCTDAERQMIQRALHEGIIV